MTAKEEYHKAYVAMEQAAAIAVERQQDPEYSEWLRLSAKFGGKNR